MRLLVGGLALIVIGFVLCVVGSSIPYAEPPTFDVILRDGLSALLTSVTKAVTGPAMSDRVQGFGSALAYVGVIMIIVWVIHQIRPGD